MCELVIMENHRDGGEKNASMGRGHESDEETTAVGFENKPLLRSRFSNMDSEGNEPREPQAASQGESDPTSIAKICL